MPSVEAGILADPPAALWLLSQCLCRFMIADSELAHAAILHAVVAPLRA